MVGSWLGEETIVRLAEAVGASLLKPGLG